MFPTDEEFLRRAIRLAMNGRGTVEPNPMVGCVIVKNDRIIGEGIHAQYGGPHAEPTALASCTEDPQGATAYVTLEPCCHLNKQTPPCAPRLIKARIKRVVIGCLDPNPDVNGKGVAMLRDAGIEVDSPLLESECKQLIAPFIARTVFRRPYVTMKWAQTVDGKIAGPGGRRLQISNQRSMQLVHQVRARCDAILVGINTVLNDDPQLTARKILNARPLIRCVLDRQLRTPDNSTLVRTARDTRLVIGCAAQALQTPAADALRSRGVELMPVQNFSEMLNFLYQQRVSHLLVEAGPTLAKHLFDEVSVDRLWVFDCSLSANDETAPKAASIPPNFRESGTAELDTDRLHEYLNTTSPVYFASNPSADLALETGLTALPSK